MIKFFKELETELKIRGYSDQTLKSYVYENQKFIKYLNSHWTGTEYQKSLFSVQGQRNPQDVTKNDIRAYIAFLMADKSLKPSTINLTLSALKFHYDDLLKKNILEDIKRPRKKRSSRWS